MNSCSPRPEAITKKKAQKHKKRMAGIKPRSPQIENAHYSATQSVPFAQTQYNKGHIRFEPFLQHQTQSSLTRCLRVLAMYLHNLYAFAPATCRAWNEYRGLLLLFTASICLSTRESSSCPWNGPTRTMGA